MRDRLTAAELEARVGWKPHVAAESYRYWLERGIIEPVGDGYRLTPAWADWLEGCRPLPAERVPLTPDEIAEIFDPCKPGPAKAAA